MAREEIIKVDGEFYSYEISDDGKIYTIYDQNGELSTRLTFSQPLLDEIEKVHGCSASDLVEDSIRTLIRDMIANATN